MERKILVAVADDHGLMRHGIVSLLEEDPTIQVVASVSSGEDAINVANNRTPDLFLLDIVMKGMTGIEATRWIKDQNPTVKVILLSSEVSKEFISEGMKMGIDGYLLKDCSKEMLFEAISAVMRGEKFFSPEVTNLIFRDFYLKETEGKGLPSARTKELSRRETEVLVLIASGKTIKEIGEHLFISPKTVETHKSHIMDKLGLTNTAQLVKYAIDHKLV
ncbi:MAG: response regulator transcription factor [Cyclobacteriaceae bacterium]|nr:response regulator transcription factor [Cyclobacteriaceae bacterium]